MQKWEELVVYQGQSESRMSLTRWGDQLTVITGDGPSFSTKSPMKSLSPGKISGWTPYEKNTAAFCSTVSSLMLWQIEDGRRCFDTSTKN